MNNFLCVACVNHLKVIDKCSKLHKIKDVIHNNQIGQMKHEAFSGKSARQTGKQIRQIGEKKREAVIGKRTQQTGKQIQ